MAQQKVSGVYVIHFSSPVGTGKQQASHYTGYAEDIDKRFEQHCSGKGARLTQVAVERGIEMTIAQVYPGKSRSFERHLKNRGSAKRYCCICKADHS